MAYVLRRAVPDSDVVNYRASPATSSARYRHDAGAQRAVGRARSRMSAYGRALLLLVARRSEGSRAATSWRQRSIGEAQTEGELSWWALDRDPLLFDFADTSVEATATAAAGAGAARSAQSAARSRRALADAEPPRRLLVLDQADRDGALRPARGACRRATRRRSRSRSTSTSTARWPARRRFTAAVADRARSDRRHRAPAARAPTRSGWSRKAAARSTGRRAATYYDTAGAAGAKRQPAARHHAAVCAAAAGQGEGPHRLSRRAVRRTHEPGRRVDRAPHHCRLEATGAI